MDSLRRIHVAAMVVAAVTSVATLYIVLGSGFGKAGKRRLRGPRGLVNTGRTCYMNAVLQAFASSRSIQYWLRHSHPNRLKSGLLKCLRVLNRDEDDVIDDVSPSYLFSALRAHGFVVTGNEQDAHELFQGLLDAIESDKDAGYDPSLEELRARNLSDAVDLSVDKHTDQTSSNCGIVNKLGAPILPSPGFVAEEELSPFCGTLTSRVDKKKDEKSSPTRSTIFNNVTLYLPRRGDILFSPGGKSAVTLETLLQMFVSLETVEDSTKQQTFARLPRCLCFHIQRTGFEAGRAYKRSDGVAFPLHLNMDQFLYVRQLCRKRPLLGQQPDRSQSVGPEAAAAAAAADETTSSICNKNSYLLCAVICHLGDMDTGHYVTYRKCYWPSGKVKWYYTSDTDVRPVDLEQVLSANPYILFYERVSPPAALK